MEGPKQELIVFNWKGTTRDGRPANGDIQATTLLMAKVELTKQGIRIKSIKKQAAPLFSSKRRRIKSTTITLFTRQLATMLKAGVPVIQAFDIIANSQTQLSAKLLLQDIKRNIESGAGVAESFKKYPLYFNELYCSLIFAGETSGSLENMLFNIALYRERTEDLIRKVKKALMYPAIVTFVALVVSAILLIFVIPQFEKIFSEFGAKLPAYTQFILNISSVFRRFWYIVITLWGGGLFLGIFFYKRSTVFHHFMDRLTLKMPIIGGIVQKASIARFSRTLAITFGAGLPLFDSLKLVEGATGNVVYATAVKDIGKEVATGQLMQVAMAKTNLFPKLVIQMIAIGEETGTLEDMLIKLAEFYDAEIDLVVSNLSTMIEPLMICVLGVVVGGIVIAMYLPMFKMASVIK